jgi:hypothetical protein
MSENITEQKVEETTKPTGLVNEDQIDKILEGIDLNTISKDDVFCDIINKSKIFSFNLLIAAALLERLIIKDQPVVAEPEIEESQSDQAVS